LIVSLRKTSSRTSGILKQPSLKAHSSPVSSKIVGLINNFLKPFNSSCSSAESSSSPANGEASKDNQHQLAFLLFLTRDLRKLQQVISF